MREQWQKPALSDYKGATFTFADMATRIAKLHALFEVMEIQDGDKIALASKNCAHWAISFLAAATRRCVAVPILPDFAPETIAGLTLHSESVVLFTETRMWENMDQSTMPNLKAAINVDDFSLLYAADKTYAEAAEKIESSMPKVYGEEDKISVTDYKFSSLDDLAIINYTSGTTSSPKGVMLTARNLSSNIEFGLRNIPVTNDDKIMSMLPLAHMYGMAFEFLYPLSGGAHVYFLGKTTTPTVLMQALADIKPYILITVPLVMEKIFKNKVMPTLNKPMMRILTSIPGVSNLIYGKVRATLLNTFGGNLRSIVLGGAAISLPVEKVMRKIRLPYTVGYGMTECAPLIGYSPWESFRLGSCGRAVDNVVVRIDSEDPENKVGEIQVHGDNVMQGYFKNPEATAATFTEDGYLRTGDLGIIDRNGNIFIKGRSKNMILSANGQNIYPEEIEAVINNQDFVFESVVVDRGASLIALVYVDKDKIKEAGLELQAQMDVLKAEVNKAMPAYSKISKVEVMDQPFEKTPKMSIKRFMYK
jgi:long-chain acyl-CoA synthetase